MQTRKDLVNAWYDIAKSYFHQAGFEIFDEKYVNNNTCKLKKTSPRKIITTQTKEQKNFNDKIESEQVKLSDEFSKLRNDMNIFKKEMRDCYKNEVDSLKSEIMSLKKKTKHSVILEKQMKFVRAT